MLAHSISYVIATIFSLTVLILTTIKQSDNLDTETGNRVQIAINIFEILNYIPWFAVQILMLLIFTKFGGFVWSLMPIGVLLRTLEKTKASI